MRVAGSMHDPGEESTHSNALWNCATFVAQNHCSLAQDKNLEGRVRKEMKISNTIAELERLLGGVSQRHCKLILLVGEAIAFRTETLKALSQRSGTCSISVGSALGQKLAELPLHSRPLQVGAALRALCEQCSPGQNLILNKIEILFDASLQLNVLELLKRQALSCCVISAWPGAWQGGRLHYAEFGHPEYRDYVVDGVVIHEIK